MLVEEIRQRVEGQWRKHLDIVALIARRMSI
jgi:hypothetical protein